MGALHSNFIFAVFSNFETISKENVKITHQTKKQKQQKHLMAEVRQVKESKKVIQRGQRSPELGGGVTAMTQK